MMKFAVNTNVLRGLAWCLLMLPVLFGVAVAVENDQERNERLRRSREDPFITPPPLLGPAEDVPEFYNPADWLRAEVSTDFSMYMVQDADGQVQGYHSVDVTVEHDFVLGDFIHLSTVQDYATRRMTDLWIFAGTYKPRRLERSEEIKAGTTDSSAGAVQYLERRPGMLVDYMFDRVTVEMHVEGMSVIDNFRQFPFSFDIEQVGLVVRQLDFNKLEWPFEAYVTVPEDSQNLPLSISKPQRTKQISAEPITYNVFEVTVRLGDQDETYWVERLPPNRLVKFTVGDYTYTLIQYLEHGE